MCFNLGDYISKQPADGGTNAEAKPQSPPTFLPRMSKDLVCRLGLEEWLGSAEVRVWFSGVAVDHEKQKCDTLLCLNLLL